METFREELKPTIKALDLRNKQIREHQEDLEHEARSNIAWQEALNDLGITLFR